jgi:hypothetical protein
MTVKIFSLLFSVLIFLCDYNELFTLTYVAESGQNLAQEHWPCLDVIGFASIYMCLGRLR